MAFKSIDDGAWTSTDDGPLSSVSSVRARDNASEASTERNPGTGIVFPADEPLRLCSVFQACSGPYFIWVPKGERWNTIEVRVRIGTVELDGASDGDEAAIVAASIGTRGYGTTSYISRPPEDPDEWVTLEKGQSTADDGIALTSFSLSTGSARGWIAVFIWIESEMRETAEEDTTLYETFSQSGAWLVEALTTTPPRNPPERACIISTELEPSGSSPRGIGETIYQLCSIEAPDSDTHELYVMPPPLPEFVGAQVRTVSGQTEYTTAGSEITIHALGVVPVQSISIEAIPRTFEPAASAFHSGSHAAEQFQHLATSVNRLVNTRRKQWLCNPGPDSYSDGNHARTWPIRSNFSGYNGAAAVSTSWTTLLSMTVLDAPADDNGYFAFISFFLVATEIMSGFSLRLSAYDGCSNSPSLQDSGEEIEFSVEQIRSAIKLRNEVCWYEGRTPYSAMAHSIAGVTWQTEWGSRGLLYWEDIRKNLGLNDWQRVTSIDLPTLSQENLTYPIELRVEAKIDEADHVDDFTFAVIGGAMRSRDIT